MEQQTTTTAIVVQEDNPQPLLTESFLDEIADTEQYEKSLRTARIWLYVIAGLQLLMGFYEYGTTPDQAIGMIAFGIDAFVAVIFFVLALWSRKSPVAAFTTALITYILIVAGFCLLDTSNIYKGIIVKVLVLVALFKANRDARKYEELKRSIG
jgi:hypothetical protein